MLVQFLSIRSERNQHFLMTLIFFVFILYSCYTSFDLNLLIVIPLFLVCIISVYFLFKFQLKNRQIIEPQLSIKGNKNKVLKKNMKWVVYPFLIYSLLTFLHFFVVFTSGNSVVPLLYDYGIGGALALGFNYFLATNWKYGICNEGLILGSKFDSKLVLWENIIKVDYQKDFIIVLTKENFPISLFSFPYNQENKGLEKLLKYKIL